MPSPQEILDGLTAIANQNLWLAITWHVAVGAGLLAVLLGWRPQRMLGAIAQIVPLASVATLAWVYGNPFNGLLFSLLGGLLLVIALRLPTARISGGPLWAKGTGLVMVTFGWVYPHFLSSHDSIVYAYAAPLGLVPCPTLSLVVGVTLLANGFDSRWFTWVLTAAGLFYGAFGALRLGVTIDLVLLAGSVALLILGFLLPPLRHEWTANST